MAIRFPPERRQPPPHYTQGPRRVAVETERTVMRAIVHPEAIRIARSPEPAPLSGASPVPPHTIVFTRKRPPPGTVRVEVAAERRSVRAIVHPAASASPRPRPLVEMRASSPTAPHRIAFASGVAPPYRPTGR